ncbi:MAG: HYR domain-containing protein, partial [Thermoanaerobaculia bacterium]|nr:HYR domain-containing protein [Thermoanaerobaculia bacterium]
MTSAIENLAPGAYNATITDANGCQVVSDATVTQPATLENEASSTNPACPDDATGTAGIVANGGTVPYTYLWNTGENTSNISSLLPGTYTVTLTDANNCIAVNTFTLIDTDAEAPAISAQNTTLSIGTSGTVSVGLQNLGASVTDNCSVASVLIEPASFSCEDIGEKEVTITATDEAGNVSSTIVVVTIIDDIAPTLTCPQAITQCWYNHIVEYDAPVAVDNCLNANGGWKLEEGLPSGSEFPVGVTNQVFSYTDASGNTGTCSFQVTITEPINITEVNVTNDVDNQSVGAIDITVTGGSTPYKFRWTNENGTVVGETDDLNGIPAG